ncbi:monocarboxylate transporter 3-like isoform X3 [Toxorhynchites rutilus septentrionalis]|uniref:monocarboxylate transporter 3-like isoform X3 n=1 Tax=Toxorhynchites rutilus septentrionalis TaxID=329112 RepID=UPI00247A545A|nr:monocarboxylate transporter 3-like isoform X3 [Toxorhynchites rutilus septentrionalis]XP_055634373.1 monocarboxylate transporter 3-like isoform X3 [Toxorhynchites rutilus septentrionalis]XP_055634374.1 monocarboxylate transporter 3-like isoform X3 [Toxorhynchites rutilus septentrionalis]XP_055634375.1 monocarboxylate transporter 3-like isoform X3 [Toxorhynchites rutilus septentrionalis]XP_055634376.1 monocarboxylate transporter 3-like isoform X3 [Toxorhynchites rutilus septentrionalis]XP_05
MSNRRVRKVMRTDSDIACEESSRLTAELQEEASPEDDDGMCEYHDMPPPPDGGYGWVIVFASFMCNMIVDGIAYTFGVFLNDFVEYFGEGKGTVAWVGSLLSGMYLSAGPVVSALANKYGCRAVCIAGSIISCAAFALSTLSTNVTMMMLTYGVMGGIGFGFIYLPAVVAVGYYFETKRSLATGIAVCGSGFGTFAFAPLANLLLEHFDWKNATLILAGLILNCAVFGAMMKPLTYPKEDKVKPLMQRMYEEKRMQMERGSIGGSYFMVQLPDGTMEKRLKAPLNADPGVHSSLALDQLAAQQGGIHAVATLPTITESKVQEQNGSSNSSSESSQIEMKKPLQRKHNASSESDANEYSPNNLPRNASQPAFTSNQSGIPKNGSVPTFDRIRKHSTGERFKPSLAAIKASSRGDVSSNGDVRKTMHLKLSRGSVNGSKNNNAEDLEDGNMFTSKASLKADRPAMVRPLSRKDIFYSGSVTNLKEYQSQKSLTNYRNSVVSLTKFERDHRADVAVRDDVEKGAEQYDLCPCLVLPESFKNAIGAMMDVSLLKDPVFMMIGISNVFGMAGLYVPFVYLVDAAVLGGIELNKASFLISIIGITNTIGRIVCGYVADFPKVDALFLNNICLVISTFAVALTPFCQSYASYVVMAIAFGIAVAGYISLTSIILVDLLGLDKLTNAFGLLILFRGAATIVGSPLAGALYDATQTYSVPFYVAGGLFGLSAIFSFAAPAMKKYRKQEEAPVHVEVLTPIDEEPSEDLADDDQPITIVPKIVQTAPSPSTEQPVTANSKHPSNGNTKDGDKEISQMESVL